MFITKIFRVAQQNKSTHLIDIGKINGKFVSQKKKIKYPLIIE